MKVKKIIYIVLAVVIVGTMVGLIVKSSVDKKNDDDKIQVVVSNFASYDFL